MYISRHSGPLLEKLVQSPLGQCLILTGARQTGKTTLLQKRFGGDYTYVSFDEPLTRESLAGRGAAEWLRQGQRFLFDEVQKVPDFLGTVKAMVDRGEEGTSIILSGSAQIQLLTKVRESLAGRAITRELYPLTVSELAGIDRPALLALLSGTGGGGVETFLDNLKFAALHPEKHAVLKEKLDHVLAWGGMPRLTLLDEDEYRWLWLSEYCGTYLQRDVADLGRVADLDNFLRLEKLAAMRTAGILNYADLARDADMAAVTAKRYVQYLTLSYQAFLLPPYRHRAKERLIKSPKLHWLDSGVQRVLSGLRRGLTGAQFESAMVAEIFKLCRTHALEVELFHLRTKDGREVDLLARLPSGGYLAWEMKAGPRATAADARHLRNLSALLDGPLLAGMVVYRGNTLEAFEDNLYGVPAHLLLG